MMRMEFARRGIVVGLIVALAVACAASPAWAKGKKKKKGGKGGGGAPTALAQAAIAIHQNQRAEAAAWQANAERRLPDQQARLDSARTRLQYAHADNERLTAALTASKGRLEEIQSRVRDGVAADSPYAMAKLRYEAARAELNQARERVLTSPNYLGEYQKIKTAPGAAAQMASIRQDALQGDAAYRGAEARFRAAETVFRQTEQDLFGQDPQWQQEVQELRKTLVELGGVRELEADRAVATFIARLSLMSTISLAETAAAVVKFHDAAINSLSKPYGTATPPPKPVTPSSYRSTLETSSP